MSQIVNASQTYPDLTFLANFHIIGDIERKTNRKSFTLFLLFVLFFVLHYILLNFSSGVIGWRKKNLENKNKVVARNNTSNATLIS